MSEPIAAEPGVLIRARPKLLYWLFYLAVMPIGAFMIAAVAFGAASRAAGVPLSHPLLLAAWAALTGILVVWSFLRDRRNLYAALTPDSLRIGRSDAIIVPFEEIRSIVLGLPPGLPWWVAFTRIVNPRAYRQLMRSRENVLLLRLSGGRYLPLSLGGPWIQDGLTLMEGLLEIQEAKIVDSSSYTAEERKRLRLARTQRIISS